MDGVDSLWERIKKQAIDGYSTAVEKADELARIGHRKLDTASIRRHIGREMMALGGRVYHLIRDGQADAVSGDSEVAQSMEKIRELETELAKKEEEIEVIRRKSPEDPDGESTPEANGTPIVDEEETK